MKRTILLVSLFAAFSALASDYGAKLQNCNFGNVQINFSLVELSGVPAEAGLYVYESTLNLTVAGSVLSSISRPAMVQEKRKKIEITYPIVSDSGNIETNQSVSVLKKKRVPSTPSQDVFKATLNTLGSTEAGTCSFSK